MASGSQVAPFIAKQRYTRRKRPAPVARKSAHSPMWLSCAGRRKGAAMIRLSHRPAEEESIAGKRERHKSTIAGNGGIVQPPVVVEDPDGLLEPQVA